MKFTKMRQDGKKLTHEELEQLGRDLVNELGSVGFITDHFTINSSRIDLKVHMKSFTINVTRLGYNASYNPMMKYKAGYKRTNLPTWLQRVSYNNIVNRLLDENNISCNVTSGPFTIRLGLDSMNQDDWLDQKPDYLIENENRGFIIKRINKHLSLVG